MATYYKGVIVRASVILKPKEHHVNFIKTSDGKVYYSIAGNEYSRASNPIILETYQELVNGIVSEEERELCGSEHIQLFEANLQSDIKKALKKKKALDNDGMSIDSQSRLSPAYIIYEKMYDKDGNAYARELITGLVFPLGLSGNVNYDIDYQMNGNKDVLFDQNACMAYIPNVYTEGYDEHISNTLIDMITGYEKRVEFSKKLYECLNDDEYGQQYRVKNLYDSEYYSMSKEQAWIFMVHITPKVKNSAKRIDFLTCNEQIANEIEVNEYLRKYKKALFNRRRKYFIEGLKRRSQVNNLGELSLNTSKNNSAIKPKVIVPKEQLRESQETSQMAELDFLLARLKNTSIEAYERILPKRQAINQTVPISDAMLKKIISLQSEIIFEFSKANLDNKQVINYLKRQIEFYLDNHKNGFHAKTSAITISELDDLYKNIIKQRSTDFTSQNDILGHIATLYFFELYENRDTLTSEELANSYVEENIKRIITVIYTLLWENVIILSKGFLFDDSNLNLDTLLALIKQIRFNSSSTYGEKGEADGRQYS